MSNKVQSQPTVKKTAFVHKLYSMLSDEKLSQLIWWTRDGSDGTFALYPGSEFASALTNYFKHGNVASFVRQLHMYGFHKVCDPQNNIQNTNNGQPIWEFKHSSGKFRKGDEASLIYIKRRSSSNSNKSQINEDSNNSMSNVSSPALDDPNQQQQYFNSNHNIYYSQPNIQSVQNLQPNIVHQQPLHYTQVQTMYHSYPSTPQPMQHAQVQQYHQPMFMPAIDASRDLKQSQQSLDQQSDLLNKDIRRTSQDMLRFADSIPKLEPMFMKLENPELSKIGHIKNNFNMRASSFNSQSSGTLPVPQQGQIQPQNQPAPQGQLFQQPPQQQPMTSQHQHLHQHQHLQHQQYQSQQHPYQPQAQPPVQGQHYQQQQPQKLPQNTPQQASHPPPPAMSQHQQGVSLYPSHFESQPFKSKLSDVKFWDKNTSRPRNPSLLLDPLAPAPPLFPLNQNQVGLAISRPNSVTSDPKGQPQPQPHGQHTPVQCRSQPNQNQQTPTQGQTHQLQPTPTSQNQTSLQQIIEKPTENDQPSKSSIASSASTSNNNQLFERSCTNLVKSVSSPSLLPHSSSFPTIPFKRSSSYNSQSPSLSIVFNQPAVVSPTSRPKIIQNDHTSSPAPSIPHQSSTSGPTSFPGSISRTNLIQPIDQRNSLPHISKLHEQLRPSIIELHGGITNHNNDSSSSIASSNQQSLFSNKTSISSIGSSRPSLGSYGSFSHLLNDQPSSNSNPNSTTTPTTNFNVKTSIPSLNPLNPVQQYQPQYPIYQPHLDNKDSQPTPLSSSSQYQPQIYQPQKLIISNGADSSSSSQVNSNSNSTNFSKNSSTSKKLSVNSLLDNDITNEKEMNGKNLLSEGNNDIHSERKKQRIT